LKASSPYRQDDDPRRFWRTAVSNADPLALESIYRRRFDILPGDRIATAGSCFAQHVANYLRRSGFNIVNSEPAPASLGQRDAKDLQYNTFSARYGNIYTTRHLLQLAHEAFGLFEPSDIVWEKDRRYFDALRPSVEPSGLDSPEEVLLHRRVHLQSVRRLLESTDIFIFTFGLTECWRHTASRTVFPTGPGVIAGHYNENEYEYKNLSFNEVVDDFLRFRDLLKSLNSGCRFVITVSPVPLTATASNDHVLVATSYSKSILRSAAGEICARCPDVDYFPSYEIITNVASRGIFFESNLRSVRPTGVDCAMTAFFSEHQNNRTSGAVQCASATDQATSERNMDDDSACEDAFLEAFAPKDAG
jgi:hypothetical protein